MTADPDRQQCGDRDAQSISDDNQSLQDLNDIIDQLEREELEALSLDIMSSPDEELKLDWDDSRTPSSDNTITPEVSSPSYPLEADLNCSVESVSSPTRPSLHSLFPPSLIDDSTFSLEKVLGPITANILAEAEAEASKYADGLQCPEVEFSEDTNEPPRIMTCQVCQLFVRTVARLLDKSEQIMDHYLPLTEEEIANLKKAVEDLDDPTNSHEMQVCFARISNLLGKLRQRAYMMTLSKLRVARKSTEDNLAQLQETINLIGEVQRVDAIECQNDFEKLTEISIQWCHRNSLQPPSVTLQSKIFSPGSSFDEICPQHTPSSDTEDLAVTICITSKVEEKEEPLLEGESLEMVPTFSTEIHYTEKIEVVPSKEAAPPPDVSSEKLPSPPAEVELEVPPGPPEEVEPEVVPSPPEEVEPEVPPSPEVEPEKPPTPPPEVEPEKPPTPPPEVEPEKPPTPPPEVEPEKPPTPPPEVEPEKPPTPPPEEEPEKPPTPPPEEEPEKPPTPPPEVEPEQPPTPPLEVEPEKPPTPPPEVEPEKPPTPPPEEEPEKPPTPPPEEEPEKPPTPPPEVEPEKPPTPPPEEEPEKPPTPPPEVEPEKPPTPPPEEEPEKPPTPPPEEEPEKPPTPPPEVEPEKPPTPPPEVEPEKPPTPPPEVEPEKPPTPPPEVTTPPESVELAPVPKESVPADVANITLTSPACEEDGLLARTARSGEDFISEGLNFSRRVVADREM